MSASCQLSLVDTAAAVTTMKMKGDDRQTSAAVAEKNRQQPPVVCTASNNSSSSSSTSSSSPSRKSSLSAECEACVSYLTRSLDRTGSKQQSLLRALGVVTHQITSSIPGGGEAVEEKIYQRSRDGRGILVQLKSKELIMPSTTSSSSSSVMINKEVVTSTRGAQHDDSTNGERTDDDITGHNHTSSTLRNRLTKLVEGIRHSADDIIQQQQQHDDSVISTSPNHNHHQQHPSSNINQNVKPKITTIAIECQSCGSDTRAEAGARAYVKGPEPLSIVLCSNRLSSQREIDEVLLHELIHIYDIKERKLDLTKCNQLAYSEVRAAREAECSNSLTTFTGRMCSKDKATVATKNMFPDTARKCVCDVFEEAMNDHSPFGVPNLNNNLKRRVTTTRASDR
jgi:hypothetical protein